MVETCLDCNGTGMYYWGQGGSDVCQTCGGKGKVQPSRNLDVLSMDNALIFKSQEQFQELLNLVLDFGKRHEIDPPRLSYLLTYVAKKVFQTDG